MIMAHSEEETKQFLFFIIIIIFTSCLLMTQPVWSWQDKQEIKRIISKKEIKIIQMWLRMQNSSLNTTTRSYCACFLGPSSAAVKH